MRLRLTEKIIVVFIVVLTGLSSWNAISNIEEDIHAHDHRSRKLIRRHASPEVGFESMIDSSRQSFVPNEDMFENLKGINTHYAVVYDEPAVNDRPRSEERSESGSGSGDVTDETISSETTGTAATVPDTTVPIQDLFTDESAIQDSTTSERHATATIPIGDLFPDESTIQEASSDPTLTPGEETSSSASQTTIYLTETTPDLSSVTSAPIQDLFTDESTVQETFSSPTATTSDLSSVTTAPIQDLSTVVTTAGNEEQPTTAVLVCPSCDANEICTDPSVGCVCEPGYSDETGPCLDLCELKCKSEGQECKRTDTSYECYCTAGYEEVTTGTCQKACPECPENSVCDYSTAICQCFDGYENVSDECPEINECEGQCDESVELCKDELLYCDRSCIEGYFLSDGKCEAVPPDCVLCGEHSVCKEGENCQCEDGWVVSSERCEDVDECSESFPCMSTETCKNTPGSYSCQCMDGYTKGSDGICVPKSCGEAVIACADAPEGLCEGLSESVTFPRTQCGFSTTSSNTCSDSDVVYGNRICFVNCTWSAVTWLSSCGVDIESLAALADEEIEDAEQVANDLEMLTAEPENLDAEEVAGTTAVLSKVVEEEDLSPEVSSSVVSTVGNLMESESVEESGESEEILDTLDAVADNIVLEEGEEFEEISTKLAMFVKQLDSKTRASTGQGQGLLVFDRENTAENGFRVDQFKLVDEVDFENPIYEGENVISSIHLSLDSSKGKISFLAFGDDVLFQTSSTQSETAVGASTLPTSSEEDWIINSDILSANVSDISFSGTINAKFSVKKPLNISGIDCQLSDLVRCVSWSDSSDWITEGCELDAKLTDVSAMCKCGHVGEFAIQTRLNCAIQVNDCDQLDTAVITGSSVTIFILSLHFVLLAVHPTSFRGIRFLSAHLLTNQNLALMGTNVMMLVHAFRGLGKSCNGITSALHLFLTVTFAVLNCETISLFATLVKPMWARKRTLREILVPFSITWGWLMPVLFMLILTLVNAEAYYGGYNSDSSSCYVCWIPEDMTKYLVLTPYGVLFGINVIIYLLIIFNIIRHNTDTKIVAGCSTFELWMNLTVHVTFSLVTAMTWTLGLQALKHRGQEDERIFSYLFAVFDICQGLMILWFFAGRNTDMFESFLSVTYRYSSPYDLRGWNQAEENPYKGATNPGIELDELSYAFDRELEDFKGLPRAIAFENHARGTYA